MISCPEIRKDVIRRHYNISTIFYRLLWGQHIHHGLWSADESPKIATRQLTEQLALNAEIRKGDRVVDIGSGMGGSSIHLAKHLDCHVTGVTISSFQRRWQAVDLISRNALASGFPCKNTAKTTGGERPAADESTKSTACEADGVSKMWVMEMHEAEGPPSFQNPSHWQLFLNCQRS